MVVLEVLDDLGIKPVALAGTSIGALIGAAYAAGMDGRSIRDFVLGTLRDRTSAMAALFDAPGQARRRQGRALQPVPHRRRAPPRTASARGRAEALEGPAPAAAGRGDGHGARSEAVFDEGPLVPAIAGSIAIPGLLKPVRAGGRTLVDGGAVNPLPFDALKGRADVLVAVDVTGVRSRKPARLPGRFDAMFGTLQIMQAAIVAAKLENHRPDLVVLPPVDQYRVLDFLKARAILAAADSLKDGLKRDLGRRLEARR